MTVVKTKKCVIKRKLKFENLEVGNLELFRSNSTWENKIDIGSIKQFIKNNKSILKIQKRFKSERHNVLLKKLKRLL